MAVVKPRVWFISLMADPFGLYGPPTLADCAAALSPGGADSRRPHCGYAPRVTPSCRPSSTLADALFEPWLRPARMDVHWGGPAALLARSRRAAKQKTRRASAKRVSCAPPDIFGLERTSL